MPPKTHFPSLKSLSRETLESPISDICEKFDEARSCIDLRMTGNIDPMILKPARMANYAVAATGISWQMMTNVPASIQGIEKI